MLIPNSQTARGREPYSFFSSLEEIMEEAGKKEPSGMCLYRHSEQAIIGGVSSGSMRWALKEWVRSHPSLNFSNVVMEAVVKEQEDMETTIAMTKKSEPMYLREEALAPSTLSAVQTAIQELPQNVSSMCQEMTMVKQDSA